jgi:hypothetical protein
MDLLMVALNLLTYVHFMSWLKKLFIADKDVMLHVQSGKEQLTDFKCIFCFLLFVGRECR